MGPQVYSVPPACWTSSAPQEGNYDFPQPSRPKEGIYDVPPPSLPKPPGHHGNEGVYDVLPPSLPSGAGPQSDVYDVPRGKRPPPPRDEGVYDVPPAHGAADLTDGVNRLSISSSGSERSSMSTSSSSAGSAPSAAARLPLDVDAALQRLLRLQQNADAAVWSLHSLAAPPQWRTFAFMERHGNDVRAALERVRAALGDVVAFGRGAAANAAALADAALQGKLRRQLGRLEDSQQILQHSFAALDGCGWALNVLAAGASGKPAPGRSDELDRFVMVSRTVPDDVKQLVSTVGAGAELLFRRHDAASCGSPDDGSARRPSPTPDNANKPRPHDKEHMTSESCVKSWMEDYDYVHLQVRPSFLSVG